MSFFGWDERNSQLEKGKLSYQPAGTARDLCPGRNGEWFHAFFVPILPESRPVPRCNAIAAI